MTLRERLRRAGVRQFDVAEAAGLSRGEVSRQLNGGRELSDRVVTAALELMTRRAAESVQLASEVLQHPDGRQVAREILGA